MEQKKSLFELLDDIVREDKRYEKEAYNFMLLAFSYASSKLGVIGHLTACDLMNGAKEYAIEQYGPMAIQVLQYWGIHGCGDFGEIVKTLVEYGLFGKSESDDYDDFAKKGFDFQESFGNFFKI